MTSAARLDFRERDTEVRELMDDPDCDLDTLHRTYERFTLINSVLSDARGLYRREVLPRARNAAAPVRVLDIGAGGADVARELLARAQRDRVPLEVVAIDPDPRAAWWALRQPPTPGLTVRRAHSSELVNELTSGDLTNDDQRFDLVISNHVLHHLDGHALGVLLADSERLVRRGGRVIHADLVRSRLSYAAFAAVTLPLQPTVLRGSFIRPDGLASIRRSFLPRELAAVVPPGWSVTRVSPWRQHVEYSPPNRGSDV